MNRQFGFQQQLNSLLDHAPFGIVIHRLDSAIHYINPSALEYLGISADQAFGRVASDPEWHFVDEYEGRLPLTAYPVSRVLRERIGFSNEILGVPQPKGSGTPYRWFLVNAYLEHIPSLDAEGVIVLFTDITERKSEFSFQQIVENANDIVLVTTAPQGNSGPEIVYVNQAFEAITGYSKQEVMGQTPSMFQGEDTDSATKIRIRDALQKQESVREHMVNYNKSGKKISLDISILPIRNHRGEVTHFASIERDVTAQDEQTEQLHRAYRDIAEAKLELEQRVEARTAELEMANQKLLHQARYDDLTDIPNRRYFFDEARRLYSRAIRSRQWILTALLDLDDFKTINDRFGHAQGDLTLQQVAKILQQVLRKEDVLGRLGGEEFSFVAIVDDRASGYALCERLIKALQLKESMSDGRQILVTGSLGVNFSQPTTVDDLETDIFKADKAMYRAKQAGKNCFFEYD